MSDRLSERYQLDRRRPERDHLAPMTFNRGAHRGRAIPRSQDPIPVRGGTTALEMAEHDGARFRASELANAFRDRFADAAESPSNPIPAFS